MRRGTLITIAVLFVLLVAAATAQLLIASEDRPRNLPGGPAPTASP